jgi:hypothetical protein
VSLSEQYLKAEYGEEFPFRAPIKLLDQHLYGLKSTSDEQVVVLSQVLAHNSNVSVFNYSLSHQFHYSMQHAFIGGFFFHRLALSTC